MLQPQWLPSSIVPSVYDLPSFLGADFKLKSRDNGSIHYSKITTQVSNIYFIHPYEITGTWEGQNGTDMHPMTGYIDANFYIQVQWSTSPARILMGNVSKTLSGWHLVGKVVDDTDTLVGPKHVVGDTI